jgi:hypothetical protein
VIINKCWADIAADGANDKQQGGEGKNGLAHLEHGSRLR